MGFGGNKSRGALDNIAVQVVPPAATVTRTDDFTAGAGAMVTAVAASATGTWAASSPLGRLNAAPAAGSDAAVQLLNLSGVTQMSATSLLELNTTFKTAGRSGIVFDRYSATDFKFAAIDVATKQVMMGHRTASGWTVDAAVTNATLNASTDYKLGVSIKGSTVSVTLNDQAAVGFVFNAVGADGRFGLFTKGAVASFDTVTVKTNDASVPAALQVAGSAGLVEAQEARSTPNEPNAAHGASLAGSVSDADLQALGAQARLRWALVEDASHVARLDGLHIVLADLPEGQLGEFADGQIRIDGDAAGKGWFIDATPGDDHEFGGQGSVLLARSNAAAAGHVDLLSVIAHEMGHSMGLGHADGGVMGEGLQAGQRATPEQWYAAAGAVQPVLPRVQLSPKLSPQPSVQPSAQPSVQPSVQPSLRPDLPAEQAAATIAWGQLGNGTDAAQSAQNGAAASIAAAQANAARKAVPAAAPGWQERFVNHLGASAERVNPNASLRLHLLPGGLPIKAAAR